MTRLHSWNAYESGLAAGINDSVLSFDVDSAIGLTAPCWVAISPEDSGIREYVKVTTIATNTLTVEARGEEGSANAPLGSAHGAGAKVRAVPVHQWLDELWDDIGENSQGLDDHINAPDPHPQYLQESEADLLYVELAGDTMTGPLVLPGDPTNPLEASTKQYVDGQDHDHATPIGAHAGDDDAHHAKYTDVDAQSAMGPVDNANTYNHVKYSDLDAVGAMGVEGDANPLNHDRYTDAEAISAVGVPSHDALSGVSTSDHHVRYADSEARSAVDNGTYLKLAGGSMTGQILGLIGTMGAPGYAFAGDPDTGMYRGGSGFVTLAGNGAVIAEFRSNRSYLNGAAADTTANSSNVYMDTGGRTQRSTSALRYKDDVYEEPTLADRELRPVAYTSKATGEQHLGFIADEVAAQDERAGQFNSRGEVEHYDMAAVVAILAAKVNRAGL